MANGNNTDRRIEELEKELAELKKAQASKKPEPAPASNAYDTPFDAAVKGVKGWYAKVGEKARSDETKTASNASYQNVAYKAKQASQAYRKKLIEEQFERARLKNALDGVETEDPAEDPANWKNAGYDRYASSKKKTRLDPFGQAEQERKKNIDNAVNGILKALAAIVVLIFVFYCFTEYQEKEQAKIDKANNMSFVSVERILRGFTDNLEGSKKQYLNERIKVSGEVTLQMSVNDSGCITLDGGDYGIAYAYFDDTSKLSHLSSGDTIVFTGELETYSTVDLGTGKILYLYFYDCELVS